MKQALGLASERAGFKMQETDGFLLLLLLHFLLLPSATHQGKKESRVHGREEKRTHCFQATVTSFVHASPSAIKDFCHLFVRTVRVERDL